MENSLIGKYRYKDEFNIENIVYEYSAYIFKIVKNMSNSLTNEDIEEIVSDVFLVIWNNRNVLKDELLIKPYLIGVTKNIIRNRFRTLNFNIDIDKFENILILDDDIDLLIEQKEKNIIIKTALDNMKEQDKDLFVSFYYLSKSIKQISNELNLTQANVKTRLHRIRKSIRNLLIKGGYSYGK